MENGEYIDAKGYMTWPKNYDEASVEIFALFEEAYYATFPND